MASWIKQKEGSRLCGGGGNDRERIRESEAVSTERDVIRKRLK